MTRRIYELQEIHNWSDDDISTALAGTEETLPINLHNIGKHLRFTLSPESWRIHCTPAFAPVFNLQASPSLHAKYYPLIQSRAIIGCYLQTELGHGSDVSQLETTASYIPTSGEFLLHSPTLTSSKWWIGGLGKTATHGVVQAKLILPGGKDVGPHLFLVQLRELGSFSTL